LLQLQLGVGVDVDTSQVGSGQNVNSEYSESKTDSDFMRLYLQISVARFWTLSLKNSKGFIKFVERGMLDTGNRKRLRLQKTLQILNNFLKYKNIFHI